jgi:hypothetical protein
MTRRASPGLSRLLLLGLALVAFAPTIAKAQSESYFNREELSTVRGRARPEYQAQGLDLGAFQLLPSLTVAPEYDDNIYATSSGKDSDLITAVTGAAQARSQWSRHEVDAFATVTSNVYANHSGEDTTDYSIGGSGRLDIQAQSNATANLSYSHSTQPRTAEDTIQTAAAPIQYDQISSGLGGVETLNRLKFQERFDLQHTSYANAPDTAGDSLSLQYLNNDSYSLSGRADYALSPALSVFTTVIGNRRSYGALQPLTLLNRNSSGEEGDVGADFDLTKLIRGQVQVGYLTQNYTATNFHQVAGVATHASVQYLLSGLTTFSFGVDRRVIDAIDPTAVSYLQSQGSFQADHELLRNLILSGRIQYETDGFKGVQRNDTRTSASFSGTYLVNRHVGVTAAYSYLEETSTGSARIGSYNVNVLSLSLVFQL